MPTIFINRDSIGMDDDAEDHQLSIDVDYRINFEEFFQLLIDTNYVPNVQGNDGVWVLTHKGEDLVSYVTIMDKFFSCYIDGVPNVTSTVHLHEQIHFKYFSSKISRAEYLFKRYDGDKYHIWHEGYMKEYESYNVSEDQEKRWTSDIR